MPCVQPFKKKKSKNIKASPPLAQGWASSNLPWGASLKGVLSSWPCGSQKSVMFLNEWGQWKGRAQKIALTSLMVLPRTSLGLNYGWEANQNCPPTPPALLNRFSFLSSLSHPSKSLWCPHSWTEQPVLSCKWSHVYPSNESKCQSQEKASLVNSAPEWEVTYCLRALELAQNTRVWTLSLTSGPSIWVTHFDRLLKGGAAASVRKLPMIKGKRKRLGEPPWSTSAAVKAVMKMTPILPHLTSEGGRNLTSQALEGVILGASFGCKGFLTFRKTHMFIEAWGPQAGNHISGSGDLEFNNDVIPQWKNWKGSDCP